MVTQSNLFCISEEELAADRAALSPEDRAAVDALPSSDPMDGLDVMYVRRDEDQPITCPKCGIRTDWRELRAGLQHHTCLGCAHQFLCEFEMAGRRPKKHDARRDSYTGPFPRKRHYHRCPECKARGSNGVNCYKQKCSAPVLLSGPCSWCRTVVAPARPNKDAAAWRVAAYGE